MSAATDALMQRLAARPAVTRTEWPARPAAVLVPLFERADGLHVLLTRRTEHVSSHKGQVAFAGGKVDPEDIDRVDTALREAEEEIGLRRTDAQVLGQLDELLTVTQWRITPVVARIPADYVYAPSPREIAEIFSVPLAWLADPANLTVEHRETGPVRPGGPGLPFAVYHFHHAGRDIWGATARILRNLLELTSP